MLAVSLQTSSSLMSLWFGAVCAGSSAAVQPFLSLNTRICPYGFCFLKHGNSRNRNPQYKVPHGTRKTQFSAKASRCLNLYVQYFYHISHNIKTTCLIDVNRSPLGVTCGDISQWIPSFLTAVMINGIFLDA